ncbi:hypothetical protein ACFWBF_27355 [Streptomyces sp. NPDC060028]|uniref:hypothetical protein n=1 Tax=Streptomyces sp. NPDC060028 TaxID=3347041 RepID=UPI0036928DA3
MSLRNKLAAAAAAGFMALGTGVLAAGPAQAEATGATGATGATETVCPSGYACIYHGTTPSSGIRDKWRQRGAYPIYDYWGRHLVVNSQTGGWKIWLCRNTNGTNCDFAVWPGHPAVVEMTPFNSVSIEP